jgi:beta-galactosidase
VQSGGKLILDGLSAFYDENAHCVMKTGFPLEDVCGAVVSEFKLVGDLFDVRLEETDLVIPAHCWQGFLRCESANPVGYFKDSVTAARNAFGRGEVLWVPALLGLGARLSDDRCGLAALLESEAGESISKSPFRFVRHTQGVLARTLQSPGGRVTILINKSGKHVDLEVTSQNLLTPGCRPEVLYSDRGGRAIAGGGFALPPEETLVIHW